MDLVLFSVLALKLSFGYPATWFLKIISTNVSPIMSSQEIVKGDDNTFTKCQSIKYQNDGCLSTIIKTMARMFLAKRTDFFILCHR